jgi:hypothetical protein
MIMRRLAQSLKEQNWTAIAIEFVLLVLGVFLGIQVANWNQERADRQRERLLLAELRSEVVESIKQVEIKQRAFAQAARSGARAIAFLDAGTGCGDACWPVIVDFFHASQWQEVEIETPTFEEMRRNGWPRQRAIVEAMDAYKRQARQIARPLETPPAYRSLVRGLIPLAIHEPYWSTCFALANGEERYVDPCPEAVPAAVSAAGVDAIVRHQDVHRLLTEWAGFIAGYVISLETQNVAARRALELIDAELGRRP